MYCIVLYSSPSTLLSMLRMFGMKPKPITRTKEEIFQNRHLGHFSTELFSWFSKNGLDWKFYTISLSKTCWQRRKSRQKNFVQKNSSLVHSFCSDVHSVSCQSVLSSPDDSKKFPSELQQHFTVLPSMHQPTWKAMYNNVLFRTKMTMKTTNIWDTLLLEQFPYIAEVMGSNPVEVSEFFSGLSLQLL